MTRRMDRFKECGLLGCFDGTGVTSENYKEILNMDCPNCEDGTICLCDTCNRTQWISMKDRLPAASYIESDNDSDPYEANMVLFYIPGGKNPDDYEIVTGWYEEENLYPFPNIPHFFGWNGKSLDDLDYKEPTHWMTLPEPPNV